MTDLNNKSWEELSSILKNEDTDLVKVNSIKKLVKQMEKSKELSNDDKRVLILDKINQHPEKIDDVDTISMIKEIINCKLKSADARKLSGSVSDHIQNIQDKSLLGFKYVTRMYRATFWTGVIMLFFGVLLTAYFAISNTPYTEVSPYLAIVFGGGGISSMFVSLRQTARKLQQSRANASQLAMALNEWQFLSLWSGKTYDAILKKYEESSENDASSIQILEKFLEWKKNLTKDMVKHIGENVGNETSTETKIEKFPSTKKKGLLPKGF